MVSVPMVICPHAAATQMKPGTPHVRASICRFDGKPDDT